MKGFPLSTVWYICIQCLQNYEAVCIDGSKHMHDKPQYFNTAISIKTTGSELLVWSSFILIAPYTQKCGSVTPSNHGLNEWINIVQSEAEGFATKHIDLIEAIVYSCLYSALKFMLQTNTAVKHRKPVTHTMFLHSIRCLKLPIKSLFGKVLKWLPKNVC